MEALVFSNDATGVPRRSQQRSVWLGAALVVLAAFASRADAFVLCAHRNSKTAAIADGAALKLRTTCKSSEQQVDPASIGLQGSLGAGNVVVRTGNTISTNGTVSTPANCNAGEVATGGGALSIGNNGGEPAIRSSRPEPDTAGATPTGWRTTVVNSAGTGTITVTAYAVCVSP
jgi:hypothetical protein